MTHTFAGLNHVNVVVSEIARAREFYIDVLGLTPKEEFDIADDELSRGLGVADAALRVIFWTLPGSDTTVEMVEYLAPMSAVTGTVASHGAERAGYGHIAFTVDDIAAAHAELVARGARFVSTPVTVPGGVRFCFLRDPDGNIVEIIQPAPQPNS